MKARREPALRGFGCALVLFLACVVFFGAPAGAAAKSADPSLPIPEAPGVYPSADGKEFVVVGAGKITRQLQRPRAERLALSLAERDARIRLAQHLFPQQMRQGPVSLKMTGVRLIHHGVSPSDEWQMHVALAVNQDKVSLVPYEPLQEHYDVRVAPVAADLLRKDPMLERGGANIFAGDAGWLVLGIGYAPLPAEADWSAEQSARNVARIHAEKAIAAAVFGSEVTVAESEREIVADGPGGAALKEWAATRFSEEVRGAFSRALPAGEWKTLDGRLGVAVVVGRPEPAVALQPADVSAARPAVRPPSQFTVEADWREAVLSRPWLFQGGIALHEQSRSPWLLVVEGAPLSGNPTTDRVQLPLLVETRARNTAVRFLSGMQVTGRDVDSEQRLYDGVSNKEDITTLLTKIAREDTLGVVAGMKRIGGWVSEDGKIRYLIYTVKLQ